MTDPSHAQASETAAAGSPAHTPAARPRAARRLWRHRRGKRLAGYKFRRQQPLGTYILDFVCIEAKLAIEIDGGQHAEQTACDAQRTRYLQQRGFTVLRFWNNEVLQQTEAVLTAILHKLEEQNAQ